MYHTVFSWNVSMMAWEYLLMSHKVLYFRNISWYSTCKQSKKGLGYSSINIARSALSALGLKFDSILVGQHPLIIRYLRGVFNLRPCRPKYTCIWDVQLVLNLLRTLSPVNKSNGLIEFELHLSKQVASLTSALYLLNL
jgi:hypothetical protein